MKFFRVFCLAVVFLASACSDQSDRDGKLRVYLAQPPYTSLTDQQIRTRLAGRQLTPDESFEPAQDVDLIVQREGGCPPIERFFPNGRWEQDFCAIDKQHRFGTWSTKNSRVCVLRTDYPQPPRCRAVWPTQSESRVIMSLAGPFGGFNPYRLSRL